MSKKEYADFFNADISSVDPDIGELIAFEEERQARRFVLIPSESIAPLAVRQALGSAFNNIYAEGYPPLRMTRDEEGLILDLAHQLAYYRRYADRRFYKGVEYADVVEALAQRRCAQCFATADWPAESIFVNVQPLSGAAANLAVYQTFLQPGDTLMGLSLFQGGHLTHGSEFNLSGRLYNVVSYEVDRTTERLDYDAMAHLARAHRPKIIVAGFTSYPWAPDWARFRQIADEVDALLMADIAHTAGMASAGAYPTPVGFADVITFTTHKTICGPRGAVIMTTDEDKARLLDAAVFPGEQGGPHVNKFAAMSVAFKIAESQEFLRLQHDIVANAKAFGAALSDRGLKLAYGGTDTHLLLVDLKPIKTSTGFPLRGEMAARILDLCGIVVNKNTIPGDDVTALASGIRMGTPWVTQRGMGPMHMESLADIISRLLLSMHPFRYIGLLGELPRAKIDLQVLEEAKRDVDRLARQVASETEPRGLGYPHFSVVPKSPPAERALSLPALESRVATTSRALALDTSATGILRVSGWRALPFMQQTFTNQFAALSAGHACRSFALDKDGQVLDDVAVLRLPADGRGRDVYLVLANPPNRVQLLSWLRGLSDGYALFDKEDVFRKVEGPVVVQDLSASDLEDAAERLCSLAIAGPDGPRVLEEMGMPGIGEGEVWKGALGGIPVTVARLSYGAGDVRFELLLHPDHAPQFWATLAEAGAVPRSPELQASLRARAGLPDYQVERPSGAEVYSGPLKAWFSLSKPYFVGQARLRVHTPRVEKQAWTWEERGDLALRRTVLYDEHRQLSAKIVPFAGWEMPVWYTSVGEEHQAVRNAAGLFDVAHMGVLDIQGENAAGFLDLVSTNYARWIDARQSLYAYLMDVDGNVIDDIMMYRQARDHYLLVVNAANADKDLAWLRAVNSGQFLIDRDNPAISLGQGVTIRDLKDPASGDDRRVDLALQGPNSLRILCTLSDEAPVRRTLARLRRTDHARLELGGMDVIVARTGYTGEEMGFELLVHPDLAVSLWRLLLERGTPLGLKPCGLAARDSTRIEAGLPLYGHELAGDHNVKPAEAGFAPYVKLHKPFFVGRRQCLENDLNREMEILRFRVNDVGVRALRGGDPVVNRRGQYIGRVTSCTLVGNRQVGMAYTEKRYNRAGTEIAVFPLPHGKAEVPRALEDLASGDKVTLHVTATVVNRLPDAEEKSKWGQPTS